MNVKETYETVKAHVIKHKEAYIFGGLGVLGIVTTILIMKNINGVRNITAGDNSLVMLDKSKIENFNFFSPGNSGNVIQDTATGEIWPSQNAAAEALNVSRTHISDHLNGKLPDLNGRVLKKLVDGRVEYELVRK